jgi:hypothetical protein
MRRCVVRRGQGEHVCQVNIAVEFSYALVITASFGARSSFFCNELVAFGVLSTQISARRLRSIDAGHVAVESCVPREGGRVRLRESRARHVARAARPRARAREPLAGTAVSII